MSEQKSNHICKNPECRKHYYACDRCDKLHSWRSVACSVECYKKYMDLVIEARTKGKSVVSKPERIDMTEFEVDALLNKPTEEVVEESKLFDSNNNNKESIVSKTINEVDIESNKKKKTSARSKKVISNDEY